MDLHRLVEGKNMSHMEGKTGSYISTPDSKKPVVWAAEFLHLNSSPQIKRVTEITH